MEQLASGARKQRILAVVLPHLHCELVQAESALQELAVAPGQKSHRTTEPPRAVVLAESSFLEQKVELEGKTELTPESAILGGFTEPSDPDIENQYINEYIVGYEREVHNDLAFGIKGIYRNYGQVIEDFLCADDGTYCFGNPGEGIMKKAFTLEPDWQIEDGHTIEVQGRPTVRTTLRFAPPPDFEASSLAPLSDST